MQPTMTLQPAPGPQLAFAAPFPLRSFDPSPAGHVDRAAKQLAALLINISRNNKYEGRDPAAISDNLASGFVADLLGVDLGTLTEALVALKQRGLVRAEHHGLRLTNMSVLERLAS